MRIATRTSIDYSQLSANSRLPECGLFPRKFELPTSIENVNQPAGNVQQVVGNSNEQLRNVWPWMGGWTYMGNAPQMISNAPQMISNAPEMISNAPEMISNAPQMISIAPQMIQNGPNIAMLLKRQ